MGAMAAPLALAACASSSTPYRPATTASGGYSERCVGDGRYLVSFSATMATPRRRIEGYLARRAAELTLAHGLDWFMLSTPNWETHIYVHAAPNGSYSVRYAGDYDAWRRYWRWYRYGFGLERYHNDPLWLWKDRPRPSRRLEVQAHVTMGQGMPPTGVSGAFLARQVLRTIRFDRKAGG